MKKMSFVAVVIVSAALAITACGGKKKDSNMAKPADGSAMGSDMGSAAGSGSGDGSGSAM